MWCEWWNCQGSGLGPALFNSVIRSILETACSPAYWDESFFIHGHFKSKSQGVSQVQGKINRETQINSITKNNNSQIYLFHLQKVHTKNLDSMNHLKMKKIYIIKQGFSNFFFANDIRNGFANKSSANLNINFSDPQVLSFLKQTFALLLLKLSQCIHFSWRSVNVQK